MRFCAPLAPDPGNTIDFGLEIQIATSEPVFGSSGARRDTGRRRGGLLDAEDGREVAQRVVGVLEAERQPEDHVQRRLGVAVAAGVEVARPALDTAARVGAGRRHAAGLERALDPRPHDARVHAVRVVDDQVRSADHVLEVVVRRLDAKVREHACNVTRRQREMYCGHARLCVCLSVATITLGHVSIVVVVYLVLCRYYISHES